MMHAHAVALETILPGVTDSQFYQEMQKLRDLIDARANVIERKLDDHARIDGEMFTAIGNRVLIMETTNATEKGQSVKRAAGVSLLISIPSGLLGLYELLKLWKP